MDTLALMDAEPTTAAGGVPSRAAPAGDVLLIKRLIAGDDLALAAAYDQYGSLVYGLARRVTRSEQAAEDITQDVFASLWERPERFDPGRGTLRAYLGVLTHRRAVDFVRSEEARRARAEREHRLEVLDWGDVSDGAIEDDTARRVRKAVDSLPADQRDAVMLAYFGGRTYREVATELGIPEGTAKSRLRLALGKLSTVLEAQGVTA